MHDHTNNDIYEKKITSKCNIEEFFDIKSYLDSRSQHTHGVAIVRTVTRNLWELWPEMRGQMGLKMVLNIDALPFIFRIS